MKNIKILIIILSIFVIGTIVAMVALNYIDKNTEEEIVDNTETYSSYNDYSYSNYTYNNYEYEEEIEDKEDNAPEFIYNTDLYEASSNSTKYTLTQYISKYFETIKNNNVQAINELGGNTQYVINSEFVYTLKEAYVSENENLTKYYTYGTLTTVDENLTITEQNVYIILYNLYENDAYTLKTITEEEYINREPLEQEDTIEITAGENNIFEYIRVEE